MLIPDHNNRIKFEQIFTHDWISKTDLAQVRKNNEKLIISIVSKIEKKDDDLLAYKIFS